MAVDPSACAHSNHLAWLSKTWSDAPTDVVCPGCGRRWTVEEIEGLLRMSETIVTALWPAVGLFVKISLEKYLEAHNGH